MSAPWPECLSLALCQSRTQLTASTGSGVCTHGSNGGEVSKANCTLRRGPGTTGTPGCHAGTRSLRSDQPRSVSGLPRGRTYPTVRNLTIVTSHVGWVLTEPVPREPGTARTEVESPAREEERGLLSSTPSTACGTPELDRPLTEAKVLAVPPKWHATTCAPLDITQATVHPRACWQKSTHVHMVAADSRDCARDKSRPAAQRFGGLRGGDESATGDLTT